MSNVKIADYEYVKAMANQPEKLLVDVRGPEEIQDIGKIPHSINIPREFLLKFIYCAHLKIVSEFNKFFLNFLLLRYYFFRQGKFKFKSKIFL